LTHQLPIFPAMVFYAVLGTDGEIEILDMTVDETYFDLIGDGPEDE
jgi:hypothetical protein